MPPASHFADRLIARIEATRSHLVVGLDPDLRELPPELLDGVEDLAGAAAAVEAFATAVIDGVAELVPAVKPQSAFFEALGSRRRRGARARRGARPRRRPARDRGRQARRHRQHDGRVRGRRAGARAVGEDVELPVHDADAVTVCPYLGPESLAPMIDVARRFGKGLFVLVRTSNPASGEVQDVPGPDGELLHERVARMVDELGAAGVGERGYADVGAVTGLTYPEQAPALRALMPRAILLVPGLGAQGGRPEDFAALPRRRRARRGRRGLAVDRGRVARARRRRARAHGDPRGGRAGGTRHERRARAGARRGRPAALVARAALVDARRQVDPRGRLAVRQVRRLRASTPGGISTAADWRYSHHSRSAICTEAANGIASSAPTIPNSVAPNSTETSTANGWISTARRWICGWITLFSICW